MANYALGPVRSETVRPDDTIWGLGHLHFLQTSSRPLQRESGRPKKENHRDRNNQVIVFISMRTRLAIVLTLRTAGKMAGEVAGMATLRAEACPTTKFDSSSRQSRLPHRSVLCILSNPILFQPALSLQNFNSPSHENGWATQSIALRDMSILV